MKSVEQMQTWLSQLSREELLQIVEQAVFPQLSREELINMAQQALNMAQASGLLEEQLIELQNRVRQVKMGQAKLIPGEDFTQHLQELRKKDA